MRFDSFRQERGGPRERRHYRLHYWGGIDARDTREPLFPASNCSRVWRYNIPDLRLEELVRYLHLNPLRAKEVPDLRALARFPWTGHNALCGTVPRSWQDTRTILSQFGPTPRRAFVAYRAFVREGVPLGPRPELQGGGLIRSLGGWAAVQTLRRGREAYLGDERVL